jgi:hypothetical protein
VIAITELHKHKLSAAASDSSAPAPQTCTRCGYEDAKCAIYRLDGQPDIVFCRRCQYAQAESFLRFCPAEEQ